MPLVPVTVQICSWLSIIPNIIIIKNPLSTLDSSLRHTAQHNNIMYLLEAEAEAGEATRRTMQLMCLALLSVSMPYLVSWHVAH